MVEKHQNIQDRVSESEREKTLQEYIEAEHRFNVSSDKFARRISNNFVVRKVNFRPIGAPESSGRKITIHTGYDTFGKLFMRISIKLHILRLKEYARAYLKYREINPAFEGPVAVMALNVASQTQGLGYDEETNEIFQISRDITMQRFERAYDNFRANKNPNTFSEIILSIAEFNMFDFTYPPNMVQKINQLNNMDLSMFGIGKNYFH